MILIAMLPTRTSCNQEHKLVVCGRDHPSLFLAPKPCVNIAPAVVEMLWYEQ